jgi:hypothetical protein
LRFEIRWKTYRKMGGQSTGANLSCGWHCLIAKSRWVNFDFNFSSCKDQACEYCQCAPLWTREAQLRLPHTRTVWIWGGTFWKPTRPEESIVPQYWYALIKWCKYKAWKEMC